MMIHNKPDDIRKILEAPLMQEVDGEEQAKLLRFAIELAKIDTFLGGKYTKSSLETLRGYKITLALEQDASSSGAQIIALTTKNKELAELSNVVPTEYKKRLYDEIAALTYNDPRFRELNKKLGLTEKDLRKAAKAQNMVVLYGAGERTGILNVEGKLSKVLDKENGTLVVKASDRDKVLSEISARMARYETFDPELYKELKALRQDVKDIFNKGLSPGEDIMEQLFFLDSKTRDLLEKMTASYGKIVTPDDFQAIAKIMSENLRSQVPILKDFTKFFGRLAEEFAITAKPSKSDIDWEAVVKSQILGGRKGGYRLPKRISEALGWKDEPLSEKFLSTLPGWSSDGILSEMLYGVRAPKDRAIGRTIFKLEPFQIKKLIELKLLSPNKLPKKWTNIPSVNFDGKVIEQNFTQVFEERLNYKDATGKWITNILQVPQKTDPTWWEQILNKDNKINDIVDASKARTAYAVNANHSNDAVIVKRYHLWGRKHNISTSSIHDAFFANASDMLNAREALRNIYGEIIRTNPIVATLDEMKARGMPQEVYSRYLNEAIDIGLIPVAGRSRVGGRLLTEKDILKESDIIQKIPSNFDSNRYWYGIG